MSDYLRIFLAFLVMIGTALAMLAILAFGISATTRMPTHNDKDTV